MKDIDVDKLLGVLDSENTKENAISLTDMLDMANKFLGQTQSIMDKLERMGLKPLLVRGAGKKLGVDAETPLKTDNMFEPATDVHRNLYENLNRMSEAQLAEMFDGGKTNAETTTD